MSEIPYNYGKYIDDTVKLGDQGVIDAKNQVQSPSSAGSRGLAKTNQFTTGKTQMQMGQEAIAESMIEIRSILNRIDGVNAPVQEEATIKPYISMYKGDDGKQVYDVLDKHSKSAYKTSDERLAQNFFKKNYHKLREEPVPEAKSGITDANYKLLMMDISSMKDRIAELNIDDDSKTRALTALGDVEDELNFDESAVKEDAGLTDQQKQGLEAIAKKYSGRKGVNGDPLIRGWITARTDSGVTSDGWDSEEVEAWEKRTGKELSDWSPEDDKQFISRSEISRDMEDELLKVMGDDDFFNKPIAGEVLDFLDDLSESYQPFPEGDEFDIEEDEDFEEVLGPLGFPEDETELFDAEYRGRKVPLNKPMRGDVKKFKVYVKDPKSGNVKKVNFGHGGTSAKRKTMRIRKSNPKARKSFRARHNCANPGPKTKARYWSCRKW